MAGGSGTRFWPYSTRNKPKQFLDILGTGETLIQQAFHRLVPLCGTENIIVVTHTDYLGWVTSQLPELPATNIITEPFKRNTAPCLMLCAGFLEIKDKAATAIVTPADHVIENENEFLRLASVALEEASKGRSILTFGIKPDKPHTGFGYIEAEWEQGDLMQGKSFHEKPNLKTAAHYLNSGNYYWNSGIFVWNNHFFKEQMNRFAPEIAKPLMNMKAETIGSTSELEKIYKGLPDISIDHALMEKIETFGVARADFGWSDLGSWSALEQHLPIDSNGNCYPKNISVIGNAQNCIFYSDQKTTFIASNIEEMIMVRTSSGTLVCPKEDEQDIKSLIAQADKT